MAAWVPRNRKDVLERFQHVRSVYNDTLQRDVVGGFARLANEGRMG